MGPSVRNYKNKQSQWVKRLINYYIIKRQTKGLWLDVARIDLHASDITAYHLYISQMIDDPVNNLDFHYVKITIFMLKLGLVHF